MLTKVYLSNHLATPNINKFLSIYNNGNINKNDNVVLNLSWSSNYLFDYNVLSSYPKNIQS